MKMNNLLSWLALILGVVIVVGSFFVFMEDAPRNLFVLNLSVSLLIYALFFIDVLLPWVDWNDRPKSRIGSIGLRWFFTFMYAVLAIAAMVLCNKVYNVEFPVQLIIHGSLLFVLILGFSSVFYASNRVSSVYHKEEKVKQGVTEMRRAVSELKNIVYGSPEMSDMIYRKIEALEENLRYISPSDNPEAVALERLFSQEVRDVCLKINSHSVGIDVIVACLDKAAYILNNRKSIYSL